jgi:3-polyprenyl-4-hydroxybenzoate decarboxylase
MPLMAVRDLYIAPDGSFVRAATFGRGVWELDAAPALSVSITSPASPVTLVKGASQNYTANVTNFSGSSTVNWTVAAGGGTFAPTSTTNGAPTTAFTAGTTAGTFAVKATAAEDVSNNTFATQNVVVVDPTSVTVGVSPAAPTVLAGATQAFTATVSLLTNTAVTWSIAPAVGSINPSTGLYTAPATPPATSQTVTVTATSTAAPTRTGTATVTVPAVVVGISPTAPTVVMNGTQQFTATVTGSANTSVTWSVQSGGGSVNGSGLYTAPGAAGAAVVRATSVADPTKFAEANVTIITAAVTVTISPTSTTVTTSATRQFTATVTNAANTNVTWSVQEGASGGSVNATGLYTAPGTPGTFHVIATSVQDNTKSATATVTVQNPVTITIAPTEAYVQPNGTRTFTGTASSGGVNYTVVEGSAGGTITSGGVYTAPATPGDYHVRATAQSDGTKTATALVHVQPLVVAVAPATVTLQTNTTQQFTATVTGNPNTAVTWSVVEGGGGSVDANGLYTAPGASGTYHVRAASVVDPAKFADATITVQSAPVLTVTVAPSTVTLAFLGAQTFTATVTNGAPGVTWSVDEAGGGTINAATGAYTAPSVTGIFHVRATSTADPTKSGTATVTVVSPVTTFNVSPLTSTVLTGGTVQLTGNVNTGTINWSTPAGSLSSATGTSVTFTAPATPGTVLITATASADVTKTLPITINVKSKDQDQDGKVDIVDLAFLTRYFGTSNAAADLNGNGIVDDADITIFLTGF